MKRPYFPLLAKVLGWLLLHLLILALAFGGFIGWQLGLGLDSLLSGSAGDRLRSCGDRKVTAALLDPGDADGFPSEIPANVKERMKTSLPPAPGPPGRGGRPPGRGRPGDGPPPHDDFGGPGFGPDFDGPPDFDREPPDFDRPPPEFDRDPELRGKRDFVPFSRPVFLVRGDGGNGYWAGIDLALSATRGQPPRHQLLLIRADRLDGSGMFFEFKPWLWGGVAVLVLSLAFWTPFVWSITRYVGKLTTATERIAAGHFKISLPSRGNDELGNLGHAIEAMAARLDHLITGQKRFLGDCGQASASLR